jgi:hypothetical protein
MPRPGTCVASVDINLVCNHNHVRYPLSGKGAAEFLIDCYGKFNGEIPKVKSSADRGRMNGCIDLLLKCATADEIATLAQKDDVGAARKTACKLQQILAWMFFGGYLFTGVQCQEQGLWSAKLGVTSVQDRLQSLRSAICASVHINNGCVLVLMF